MTDIEFVPGVSVHAREQFRARFGFSPSRDEWRATVLSIVERRAVLLAEMTSHDGKERWLVDVAGVSCSVIWAPRPSQPQHTMAQIVTVLPPHAPALNPRRTAQRSAHRKGRGFGSARLMREACDMEGWE